MFPECFEVSCFKGAACPLVAGLRQLSGGASLGLGVPRLLAGGVETQMASEPAWTRSILSMGKEAIKAFLRWLSLLCKPMRNMGRCDDKHRDQLIPTRIGHGPLRPESGSRVPRALDGTCNSDL